MKKIDTDELTKLSTQAKDTIREKNLNQQKEDYWRSYETGQSELAENFQKFKDRFVRQVKASAKEGEKEVQVEVIKISNFEFKYVTKWHFALLLKCLDFGLEQDLLVEPCEIWEEPVDDTVDPSPKALGIRAWGW